MIGEVKQFIVMIVVALLLATMVVSIVWGLISTITRSIFSLF